MLRGGVPSITIHHNFGIFASTYAPVLATPLLEDSERTAACAFILPIAPTVTGPAFLIPLQDGQVFGIVLRDRPSHKVQVENACAFLSIGIESQYMHGMRNGQRDIVVAVPWDRHPVRIVTSPEELKRAQATKQPSAWCTVNALLGSPAHEPALLAVERCSAMGAPVWHDELNVGIWHRAKTNRHAPTRASLRTARARSARAGSVGALSTRWLHRSRRWELDHPHRPPRARRQP